VLVTGASSGIGAETARKLGAAGATTLLVARGADALEGVATDIRAGSGSAHVLPCDLTDEAAIDALVADVVDRFGGVDVLVNNAGRSIRRSVAHSFDRPHDFERTMQLNYFASLRLILGFLPGMRERRRGHVVNVSTMGVQTSPPRFAAYIASKAALDAFTRVLAAEVHAYGVRCSTVQMPLVRTPMIAPTKAYDRVPALSPDDAAEMVCEAVRSQRALVELPVGLAAELTDVVFPGLTTRVRRAVYHAGRDSRAARDGS
jgi:NAD(P)-dependent dehydrogenase (short-subunit alcohol dehydrogenase family)